MSTEDDKLYNEITRLNNELVNAQRDLAQKNRELEDIIRHDALTGAGNRRALTETFNELKNRSLRLSYPSTLAIIDINNFKKVNDTKGHAEGDQLLAHLVKLAIKKTRVGLDYVFRIGGDEFLILFTNCNEEQATKVIGRIDRSFCKATSIASLAYGAVDIDYKMVNSLEVHMSIADNKMYTHKEDSRL